MTRFRVTCATCNGPISFIDDDPTQPCCGGCRQSGDGCTCVLPEGTRIFHKRLPELTGYIKAHEWTSTGVLSGIPYLIGWDDSARAHDLLGWFFVYAGNESVAAARDEVPA